MGSVLKINRQNFCKEIQEYKDLNKCTYIDSILSLCEKYDIDPDAVKPLISKPIKEKVEVEMRQRNLLPKTNTII